MSGGTYEVRAVPPWGMTTIAEGRTRLGASAAELGTLVIKDLAGCARPIGAPKQLAATASKLGGAVTGLEVQTRGGLRVALELEVHPQATHARHVAVRASVSPGQHAACHQEGEEIVELFRTLADAGWSFSGAVAERPPGGGTARAHHAVREAGR